MSVLNVKSEFQVILSFWNIKVANINLLLGFSFDIQFSLIFLYYSDARLQKKLISHTLSFANNENLKHVT